MTKQMCKKSIELYLHKQRINRKEKERRKGKKVKRERKGGKKGRKEEKRKEERKKAHIRFKKFSYLMRVRMTVNNEHGYVWVE